MNAAHLADWINIESESKLFRFALDLALEQFITELRLRIEHVDLVIALQGRQLSLQKREVGGRLLVRQIFHLIVMRFDSVKRFIGRMTCEIFIPAFVEEFVNAFRFSRDLLGRGSPRRPANQHKSDCRS